MSNVICDIPSERCIIACAEAGLFDLDFNPKALLLGLHRDLYLICLACHEAGLHPDLERVCRALARDGYGVSLRLVEDVEHLLTGIAAHPYWLETLCRRVTKLHERRKRLAALRRQADAILDVSGVEDVQ